MIKRLLSFVLLLSITFAVIAQPAGYYTNAEGKTGATLKTALYNIIKGHTERSYANLWTDFQTTDKKSNGKVWDMYSDKPGQTPPYEFTFITEQCGNYSNEGDCYNREHSFPKSWFNDGTPMYTDLFHLYPTDGKVNGMRSNFPFGEVSSPTWTSLNGSKLGPNSYSGYSGTVFEPIDDYKGDFARSYFYMVTRYEDVLSTWNTDMLDGSTFPAFSSWAKNMLLEWSQQDPVSIKEIDRNNAVYAIQNNRNPYIDHPEYAQAVWGNGTIELSFTSTPTTSVTQGQLYSYAVKVTGPVGATFTITSPIKPAWLNITPGTNGNATLSGTPSAAGSDNVTLSVTDGTSTKTQSFTITVTALDGLKFNSTPILSATTGSPYSYSIVATNQSNTSASLTIGATTKPAWLTLTSTGNGTATLSGTPSAASSDIVTLTANDGTTTVNQNFTITVAQGGLTKTETFTNIVVVADVYANQSWTGDDGSNWTTSLARTDQTLNGKAICLKNVAGAYVQSGTLSGGCKSLSFKVIQVFSGTGGNLTLYINNVAVGTPFSYNATEQTATFTNINVAGDFVIKLENNGTARPVIDDVTWTGYTGVNALPTITNITNTPLSPTTNDDVIVSASISDSDGSIQQAWLEWGTTASNLNNDLPMTLDGAVYKATIPAQAQAGIIYLSINARDNSNDISTVLSTISIVQNQPPVISNISNIPFIPTVGESITISSNITDSDGTIQEVWLDWGNASNNLSNRINMTYLSGSYMATIPAQTQSGIIYLAVSAKDNLLATSSTPFSFTLSSGTFVNHEEGNSRIKVYPNPAKDQISVEVQELNSAKITISNIIGETLISSPFNGSKQTFDISGLKSGVYFVVVMGERFKNTTRIVVY